MRQSEAAIALIRRVQDGQTLWLAQWNPKWRCFHFVSGHRRPEESFRECLVREIAEELGLREGADYQVVQANPTQLDFIDFSESSRVETRYIMGLFNVQLKPGTDREVDGNPANRWLTEVQIQSGKTSEGQPVSATMKRVLAVIGREA